MTQLQQTYNSYYVKFLDPRCPTSGTPGASRRTGSKISPPPAEFLWGAAPLMRRSFDGDGHFGDGLGDVYGHARGRLEACCGVGTGADRAGDEWSGAVWAGDSRVGCDTVAVGDNSRPR